MPLVRSRDSCCQSERTSVSCALPDRRWVQSIVKKLTQLYLNGRWICGYLLTQLGAPQFLEKATLGQLLGETIVKELG